MTAYRHLSPLHRSGKAFRGYAVCYRCVAPGYDLL